MGSINYRGEFEVNAQGYGTKGEAAPAEFLGAASGSVSISVSNWEPGTYLVMISKVGMPTAEQGDQNKEGAADTAERD